MCVKLRRGRNRGGLPARLPGFSAIDGVVISSFTSLPPYFLGRKLYDAFCEQQPQTRGHVDAAAAAAEAAVVTNGADGGDTEGAGWNNGAELISRVAFFLRVGKYLFRAQDK